MQTFEQLLQLFARAVIAAAADAVPLDPPGTPVTPSPPPPPPILTARYPWGLGDLLRALPRRSRTAVIASYTQTFEQLPDLFTRTIATIATIARVLMRIQPM
jgi:hypothetical protein